MKPTTAPGGACSDKPLGAARDVKSGRSPHVPRRPHLLAPGACRGGEWRLVALQSDEWEWVMERSLARVATPLPMAPPGVLAWEGRWALGPVTS